MRNVVPCPTSLFTWILPPLCFTIPYTVANPSPVPLPIGFVVKNARQFTEIGFILCDQNRLCPSRPHLSPKCRLPLARATLRSRQVDPERRSASHLALYLDASPALLHDSVHRR